MKMQFVIFHWCHVLGHLEDHGTLWGGGILYLSLLCFVECEYMGTSLSLSIKEQFNIRGPLRWLHFV